MLALVEGIISILWHVIFFMTALCVDTHAQLVAKVSTSYPVVDF